MVLHSLSRDDLNGQRGIIMSEEKTNGRHDVQLLLAATESKESASSDLVEVAEVAEGRATVSLSQTVGSASGRQGKLIALKPANLAPKTCSSLHDCDPWSEMGSQLSRLMHSRADAEIAQAQGDEREAGSGTRDTGRRSRRGGTAPGWRKLREMLLDNEQRRRTNVEETGSGDAVMAASSRVLMCLLNISAAALVDRRAERMEGVTGAASWDVDA